MRFLAGHSELAQNPALCTVTGMIGTSGTMEHFREQATLSGHSLKPHDISSSDSPSTCNGMLLAQRMSSLPPTWHQIFKHINMLEHA